MNFSHIIAWQQAAIVALLITNGLSLAVALIAVSIIRLGWADHFFDRMRRLMDEFL
jgi:hypothetical protein